MIPSQTADGRLQRAFAPTRDGIIVKRPSPTVVYVAFVNTPDEQRLEVKRNPEGGDRPSAQCGPDAALRAAIEPLAAYISASSNPRGALAHGGRRGD